jgi:ATP-dependent DNA helicase DinG
VLEPGALDERVMAAHDVLDERLAMLESMARERKGGEAVDLIGRRAALLRSDLRDVLRGARTGSLAEEGAFQADARVTWVESRSRSVSLGASPVDLGATLRTRLFDRTGSVVCTSATLATGQSFHFVKSRLGSPPEAAELVVSSPFDFASRAALYLPSDLPEPNDPAFDDAAAGRIADLVRMTDGGAFVLCTSNRSMRSLHARLGKLVERTPLMVQGEAPKAALLGRFRSSGHAVLVATMSFWEGVDVPGWALRLVVIDKIPFAVPTDPIVVARSARIDREGGNSFAQYSVPTAALTLKQGFGRLIRTQDDAGIVAVLDKRIVKRGYGRMLLASLPPAQRVAHMNDLRTFWEEIRAKDD